jgi:hypothetical protein
MIVADFEIELLTLRAPGRRDGEALAGQVGKALQSRWSGAAVGGGYRDRLTLRLEADETESADSLAERIAAAIARELGWT